MISLSILRIFLLVISSDFPFRHDWFWVSSVLFSYIWFLVFWVSSCCMDTVSQNYVRNLSCLYRVLTLDLGLDLCIDVFDKSKGFFLCIVTFLIISSCSWFCTGATGCANWWYWWWWRWLRVELRSWTKTEENKGTGFFGQQFSDIFDWFLASSVCINRIGSLPWQCSYCFLWWLCSVVPCWRRCWSGVTEAGCRNR